MAEGRGQLLLTWIAGAEQSTSTVGTGSPEGIARAEVAAAAEGSHPFGIPQYKAA